MRRGGEEEMGRGEEKRGRGGRCKVGEELEKK